MVFARYRSQKADGQEGIALLLVLIIFIVLYLVVYQLDFSSKMQAKIAQVRYGNVEASSAMDSVALYVMTLLTEDLNGDLQGGGASDPMAGMPGRDRRTVRGGTDDTGNAATNTGAAPDINDLMNMSSPGGAAATPTAATGWYDYARENIFLPNEQQIGGVDVKITITDGESRYDLNRLFNYPRRLEAAEDEALEGMEEGEDETGRLAAGDDQEGTDASSVRERILRDIQNRQSRNSRNTGPDADAEEGATADDGRISRIGEDLLMGGTDEYTPDEPMLPPLPEQIQATQEMLARAILIMISGNENNGFGYDEKYFPENIAAAITDYVLERRSDEFNNRIQSVNELLSLELVTPELFYGPVPIEILEGDEYYLDGFALGRDEYGDVAADFTLDDMDEEYLEQEREEISNLLAQSGLVDLPPELGFDRLLSSSLTRGMSDWPRDIDENGEEVIIEPPLPMGLRDLFTTYSTGKININTASVPVIAGLLLSLEDTDANRVALDMRDYLNRFPQEEGAEDGIDKVGEQGSRTGRDASASEGSNSTNSSASSTPGSALPSDLSALMGEGLGGSSYQDTDTNYFTSLDQLELIDGEDGGPEDFLQSEIENVDDRNEDNPLNLVKFHLEKVHVFGSTYFNVEMKAKTENAPSVKVGYLTVKRDAKKKMMEVLMWKETHR